MFERFFIRNINGDKLLESFLLSAVASILTIRFVLNLTGYPQLGYADFYIAHMLWGGLLMVVAIVVLFNFLTKLAFHVAAILGGVGFGVFIDELGKFITRDNDYFFEPTVALIYVIFVLLYLGGQVIEKVRHVSKTEYLINALELIKQSVVYDLEPGEKKRAIEYLRKSEGINPIVAKLKLLLSSVESTPTSKPIFILRYIKLLRETYKKLVDNKWFIQFVILFFAIHALFFFFHIIVNAQDLSNFRLSFPQFGEFAFSALSAGISLVGITQIRRSRLLAYISFKYSILVTIFLTQVFLFYRMQFVALLGLAFNILVLITLEYMIDQERSLKESS